MKTQALSEEAVNAISPKQIEACYVILKTLRDFRFSTPNGISYTEVAKHLFIAKQNKLEVRIQFDYPANFPTCPSTELLDKLERFERTRLVVRTITQNGMFFKITQKGIQEIEGLENTLKETLPTGFDTILTIEELHRKENLKAFGTRRKDMTPTEELQRKEVSPLMLDLIKETKFIYTNSLLRRINRSDLIISGLNDIEEDEIEAASLAAKDCLDGKKNYTIDEQAHELTKKGEIPDFIRKLMYGMEKFNKKGFLAETGELALLFSPVKYLGRSVKGHIYSIGNRFVRRILLRVNSPLGISSSNREIFVLVYLKKNISEVLAIGVPDRFYDELISNHDDYIEQTLDRILSVIRPHLNMGGSNGSLKKFYDYLDIRQDERPDVAIAKIMLWLQRNIGILNVAQVKVEDPYPEFEKTFERRKVKGYVNNCKEFTALVAILLTCLPINTPLKLYVQFCTAGSGRSHVRVCVKNENNLLCPLDLDFSPDTHAFLTHQIGGNLDE